MHSSFPRKEDTNDDMKVLKSILPILAFVTVVTAQSSQAPNPVSRLVYRIEDNSVRTTKGHVERTTNAVNYAKRSGVTRVGFHGTGLLATAHGEATVQNRQGSVEIAAEFDGLSAAMRFGPEYLTYVMWAITPEGRATNLGEVAPQDTKSKLTVTTRLETVGLIVTAEPYFAVSQPSDVVVMENVFTADSAGERAVEARYELLPRGSYTANVSAAKIKPIVTEPSTPLDLYEARNALWIALWAGAEQNASEQFATAERLLQRAEAFHASRAGEMTVSAAARESVQIAENARSLAVQRGPAGKASL
jgi:hypothetical protein